MTKEGRKKEVKRNRKSECERWKGVKRMEVGAGGRWRERVCM